MIKNRKWLSGVGAGVALGAMAVLPVAGVSSNAEPMAAAAAPVLSVQPAPEVGQAATAFVEAMAGGDEAAVWMFATEEEHDAFGTEKAAFAAYADAFPVLIRAEDVLPERTWQEGDTPFVEARIVDEQGETYRATFGFWLSDAGDWQLVSADVIPYSDRVAGL